MRSLAILPIGLVFERKERPRSRVFVEIGEPILLDNWRVEGARSATDVLTAEIASRLRALTLSYPDTDAATRATKLAMALASLVEPIEAVSDARGFAVETEIARRVDTLTSFLGGTTGSMRGRASILVERLRAVEAQARARGIVLDDARIELGRRSAVGFVLREGRYLLAGGPIALWGRVNHWLPFRATRLLAMRNVESAADPATRTIVAGAALVLIAYLAQTLIVASIWGAVGGLLYLISLPIAAEVNFQLTDRMHRAIRRARAYLVLRRDPELRRQLGAELASLRADVLAFDRDASAAMRAEKVAQ